MYNNKYKEDDKMYNIPTNVNTNYIPKKRIKIIPIIIILFSIGLFITALYYIKIFNTHGHSMQPTINDNSYVICIKSNNIEVGDIIAFKSHGEIKIKRIIALSKDKVNITKAGKVFVNDKEIKESYLTSSEHGEIEIPLPHTVSENSVFVLGDNRSNSIDSRHHQIGDVKKDEIICEVKIVL